MATSLERYRTGLCNYPKHELTTARIEAGNAAIILSTLLVAACEHTLSDLFF